MALNTLGFVDIVRRQVAAIQGGARNLIDFSIGSVLRAMVEANAAVVIWLQGLILQLLATTRAATSNGSDLDSFVNDFGMARLPAVAATGQVTFARYSTGLQSLVPVGATVQSADGTQQYTVNLDTSNPAYSASLNGFVLASGISSLNVAVTAVTAGAAGNAQAGAINTLSTSIAGVDTVSNGSTFTTGQDAESDPALRARFINYIASLAKATKGAIGYAVMAVQSGLTYMLVENFAYNGAAQNGFFYVVVDDGSGSPPSALLSTVGSAIDAVRPLSSTFGVFGPTLVNASVAMTITTAAGYVHATLTAAVQAAIIAYINSLPLGKSLYWTRLIEIAYDTSPGVVNVSGVSLNGGTADLVATAQQIIKTSTCTVS